MKLRHRILLCLGVTVVCLLIGIYNLSSMVLLRSYARLEHQDAERNVERANRAFFQLIGEVHEKSVDWSSWDDTYVFLANHNKTYIDSNLDDASISSLHLDFILFVDTKGQLFHAKTVKRFEKLPSPSPETVLSALRLDRPLSQASHQDGFSGVIRYPSSPLLISVRPILTTKFQGPSHGWLIFGRYFDPGSLKSLAERTRLEVRFEDLRTPALSQVSRNVLPALTKEHPIFVRPQDSQTISGYTLIPDIHQQPIQLLTVPQPRTIYHQGVDSANYFLRLMLLTALIFSVMILLALEFFVLSRLSKLTGQVDRIGSLEKTQKRVYLPGKDELTGLAEHINAMLGKLDQNAQSLRDREQWFRSAISAMHEGFILQKGESELLFFNQKAEEILGITAEQVAGHSQLDPQWRFIREDGSEFPREMRPMFRTLHEGIIHQNVIMGIEKPDEEVIWISVNAVPLFREDESHPYAVVMTFTDITERRWLEDTITEQINYVSDMNAQLQRQQVDLARINDQLHSLATTDGLTGLKNHRAFQEKLAEEFERSRRYRSPLSLLLLDVDHFKQFNDTFGHPAGDIVLKKVASILQESVRTTDVVARYGGEEFVILLPDTDREGALHIAERVRRAVEEYRWEESKITISVGGSAFQLMTGSALALLTEADQALYTSKAEGRNRVTFYRAVFDSVPPGRPSR